MRLHQGSGIAGVSFKMQNAVGVRVEHGVTFDLLVGWKADNGAVARRDFDSATGWIRGTLTPALSQRERERERE